MDDHLDDGTIVDILVVGSGGGIAGAYTAAHQGYSVALIEASDQFGGTTAYSSGGGMWFPCNPVLMREGCDDTPDEAYAYFHEVVGDRTPEHMQRAYVYGGAAAIAYFERDERLKFKVLPWPDYYGAVAGARTDGMRHIVARAVPAERLGRFSDRIRGPLDRERHGARQPDLLTGGRALVGRFIAALDEYPNATLHLNTVLIELLVEDGRVVGATLLRGGEPVTVRTRLGVLLAAGGFEHNPMMRERYQVPGWTVDTMGAPANDGRVHMAAMAIGASTDLMDQAWWSPGLIHPGGRAAFALCFTGGIFVDRNGRRFTNESAPYDRLGRDVIAALESGTVQRPFWMIYDNRSGDTPPILATNVALSEPSAYRAAGLWRSADTLEGLAAELRVPADNLVRTVQEFNTFAAQDHDADFGRGQEAFDRAFSGTASPLVPIDTPPFHAAAFGLSDLGTKGGLRTDEHGNVLHLSGEPIPGLYAAGNTMAAVSGLTYPGGGIPIGASVLFSHRAVMHMTRQGANASEV
ncbi:3-ketosteroid-delta-1-dehydrogenase [Mycobacterium sp. CBMA 234]|nr:3-ketosteroid-delta-1-dehydrogenase [Mycolicibacterium sp. CBMA 234]